jgi:hypothetical protein
VSACRRCGDLVCDTPFDACAGFIEYQDCSQWTEALILAVLGQSCPERAGLLINHPADFFNHMSNPPMQCHDHFTAEQVDRVLTMVERHPLTLGEWGISGVLATGTMTGDVLLLGDVSVAAGSTVQLGAGSAVWAAATDALAAGTNPTRVEWVIRGSVVSEGTPAQPVTMRVLSSDPAKRWGPIVVYEGAGQTLSFDNVVFEDLDQTPVTDVVLSPNGGELVHGGEPVTVTWTTASSYVGTPPDREIRASKVDLELLRDGEAPAAIVTGAPNTGSYVWTPDADQASSAARVKVVFHHPTGVEVGHDESDASFVVVRTVGQFVDRSSETGLNYLGTPYSSAAFDYDGNGHLDLMVTQTDQQGQLYAWGTVSGGGAPTFDNMTLNAFPGAGNPPQAGLRGLAYADFDNDGRPDVFAAAATGARLYRNKGLNPSTGFVEFEDLATTLNVAPYVTDSWAAAWGHFDHDGRLDLAVGKSAGTDRVVLLHNETTAGGGGQFVDATVSSSLRQYTPPGIDARTVAWADFDRTGWQDLFVGDHGWAANGGSMLFENAAGSVLKPPTYLPSLPYHGVTGVAWGDLDGDLDLDFALTVVPASPSEPSVWYFPHLDSGNPFQATGQAIALGLSGANGVLLLDQNADARTDLLVLPAAVTDAPRLVLNVRTPGGFEFLDETARAGLSGSVGRVDGAAVGDFDGDQRVDAYLGRQRTAAPYYYRNQNPPGAPAAAAVGVLLQGGLGGNDHFGMGSRVELLRDGQPIAVQTVDGGSSRGGQRPPVLSFGAPTATGLYEVEVTWPEGYVQRQTVTLGSTTVVEDGTNPQINPSSMTASYTLEGPGLATWSFGYDVAHLPKAGGNEVVVSSTAGCLNEPITLSAANASVAVTAKQGGGWHVSVVATGMECIPNCVYTWYCRSWTRFESSSTQPNPKTFKTKVCAQ